MQQRPHISALPARTGRLLALAPLCLLLGAPLALQAQEVRELSLQGVPPDLIQDGAPRSPSMAGGANDAAPDLGQNLDYRSQGLPAATPGGNSAQAAAGRERAGGGLRRVTDAGARAATLRAGGAERAVFAREPIRVAQPVGRERLITLPAPAALHVPTDIESVARLEVIDRTLYATALMPFTPLRIVAELIDSGQQIPMDLVANSNTAAAGGELQVSVLEPGSALSTLAGGRAAAPEGPAGKAAAGAAAADPAAEPQAADMVQLTRHAARQLYAPRRLAWDAPGVYQIALPTAPVNGLLRGVNADTVPLGQWKSGTLYVTAVRVTNRSRFWLELPLENIRGRWIAATAQHGRIGPAGSDTDTTAVYLVCDRSFEACL